MKQLQNANKENLFCTLFIFMMRNLLLSEEYRELGLLLKSVVFPEKIQFQHYCKYLFYKGDFFGRVGDYKNSFKYMEETMRRSPQLTPESSEGLKMFVLRTQKHFIVLDLLMNELPSPSMFEKHPELDKYK